MCTSIRQCNIYLFQSSVHPQNLKYLRHSKGEPNDFFQRTLKSLTYIRFYLTVCGLHLNRFLLVLESVTFKSSPKYYSMLYNSIYRREQNFTHPINKILHKLP